MFLVIDNYDSFTYNLVQYLGELASDHPIAEEVWDIHKELPEDQQLDRDTFMKRFYSAYSPEYYDMVELVSD